MGLLRSCSQLPAIAVIVAAGLVVAACSSSANGRNTSSSGTSSSTPVATKYVSGKATYASRKATVIGKSTDVVVNPALSVALKHAGITVTAVAPATAKTTLLFPVSGGQIVVATLAGTVDHTGGLTFRHSGKSVTLTNLVINTNTKHLTATVGGHPMPIFDLNLASTNGTSGPNHILVASNIKLTVRSRAATALNNGLGVSTFKVGMNFGIATLTVAYARGHR
jgi:hypothetical protein